MPVFLELCGFVLGISVASSALQCSKGHDERCGPPSVHCGLRGCLLGIVWHAQDFRLPNRSDICLSVPGVPRAPRLSAWNLRGKCGIWSSSRYLIFVLASFDVPLAPGFFAWKLQSRCANLRSPKGLMYVLTVPWCTVSFGAFCLESLWQVRHLKLSNWSDEYPGVTCRTVQVGAFCLEIAWQVGNFKFSKGSDKYFGVPWWNLASGVLFMEFMWQMQHFSFSKGSDEKPWHPMMQCRLCGCLVGIPVTGAMLEGQQGA